MKNMKLCIGVDWDRQRLCITENAEPTAHIEVHFSTYNAARGPTPMATIITDTQQVKVAVSFLDKRGNPAIIDGSPEWTVSDPSIVGIEESDEGYSATVFAQGPIGHAQVVVTADSKLGDEINPISGILELDVIAGEAVTATVTAGTPEEQEA